MGLQYRKKRLKRIDKRGFKEHFLKKEHHSMSIIQQLTDVAVDRRLLAKAHDLINLSEETEENNNGCVGDTKGSIEDRKRKNDQPENMMPKKKTKVNEMKKNEKKSVKEESKKNTTGKKEQRERDSKKTAVEPDTEEGDDESLLESNDRKVSENKQFDNSRELDTEEEDSDEEQNAETESEDSEMFEKEENFDGQKRAFDSEDSAMSNNEGNSDEDQSTESDSEESAVSDIEGSEEFDSEGSIVDENYEGEKITSIWDDCDMKKKDSKTNRDSGPKLLGNANLKCKGTIAVKQLDLSKKDCIDDLLQKDDKVSSGSDEEDFFIRGPVSKKKKRNKTKDEEEDECNVVEDAKSDGDFENDGFYNEDVSREKYLEKNFKKIWGQGMEDTIRLSQARRGVRGGGRGRGFDDSRGAWYDDRRGTWSDNRRGTWSDDRGGRWSDDRRGKWSDDGRGKWSNRRGKWSDDTEGRESDDRRGKGFYDGRGKGRVFDNRRGKDFDSNRGRGFDSFQGRGGFRSPRGRGFSGRGRGNANLMPLGSKEVAEEAPGALLLGKREYDRKSKEFEHWRDSSWKSSTDSFNNRKRFNDGRRDEEDNKGWQREKFQRKGSRNPNLMPFSENPKFNTAPAKKESQQESLLHPSWLAKQKQKEMASSIHIFKGQKKTFDLDD